MNKDILEGHVIVGDRCTDQERNVQVVYNN